MENHSAVNLLQFRAEEPWINWVSYLQWELFLVMALFSSLPSAACLKIKKKGMHLLSHSDWGTIVLHFSLQPYLSHSNSASTATYESVLLTVRKTHLCNFYSEPRIMRNIRRFWGGGEVLETGQSWPVQQHTFCKISGQKVTVSRWCICLFKAGRRAELQRRRNFPDEFLT